MSSVDVYIVVEGQTEQTFVRDVLAPQMAAKEIYLYPVLIGKPGHKGGCVHFNRAKNDIGNFFRQRKNTYITTMFDYFRIDSDWPGKEEIKRQTENGITLSSTSKAEILESATCQKIGEIFGSDSEKRFIPYIEMHEFEALLFSDVNILAEKTDIDVSYLTGIIEEHHNPEEINDDPAKAPSKRLEALNKGYRKVAMGKAVSEAIGIEAMRRQCPHFDNWLAKLEHLKGNPDGKAKS
ncbi:MAG: hypothetical protein BWK80_53170 [Desulfobacteraceae bacterium IS3]|nr:MAG: hypothetical protein BWK80_53170 [Desulfobacteraceae bacterium IS3]